LTARNAAYVTPRAAIGSISPGTAHTLTGPHEFLIRGAAEPCRTGGCYYRLHIFGQAGTDRPGWDVTDMAPLALRP